MSTKEILTLQFGPYSNFIGTHCWNMQELSFEYSSTSGNSSDINHDVLFREGQTARGEVTYTPRLLITDLKGSLKSVPELGTLYEPPCGIDEVDAMWMNRVEKQVDVEITKNDFQKDIETKGEVSQTAAHNLYENVNVWSDFLYTRFHPRSVNVVKHFENIDSFDSFPLGCMLWNRYDYQDEFTDKIRRYVEECDHLQGFQVLLDGTNAFGGVGTSCVEYLSDEFSGKSIFALPVIPSYYSDYDWNTEEERMKSLTKDVIRVLNLAFTFKSLAAESSIFTPLCVSRQAWRKPSDEIQFNRINYKVESPYETSAILASAINTFSLKYRLKDSSYTLGDLTSDLTKNGRKAVAASLCLPFSFNQGTTLLECLDNWDGPLTKCITPHCTIGDTRMMQLLTLRGIKESNLKLPLEKAHKQRDLPAYKCNTISEMLNSYCTYSFHACATNITSVQKGLCVKPPFPQQMFDDKISSDGFVGFEPRLENQRINEVPALSGLHSGSEIGQMVESLHSEARRIKLAKFHQFTGNGFGKDEFEECLDNLFSLRECYEDNMFL